MHLSQSATQRLSGTVLSQIFQLSILATLLMPGCAVDSGDDTAESIATDSQALEGCIGERPTEGGWIQDSLFCADFYDGVRDVYWESYKNGKGELKYRLKGGGRSRPPYPKKLEG